MRSTISKTIIDEVKDKNKDAGMSYNEAKQYIARTTAGKNTKQFSDTNSEEIKQKLRET